jgi:hypothetical protein
MMPSSGFRELAKVKTELAAAQARLADGIADGRTWVRDIITEKEALKAELELVKKEIQYGWDTAKESDKAYADAYKKLDTARKALVRIRGYTDGVSHATPVLELIHQLVDDTLLITSTCVGLPKS